MDAGSAPVNQTGGAMKGDLKFIHRVTQGHMKRSSRLYDSDPAGCEIRGKAPRCVNRIQG